MCKKIKSETKIQLDIDREADKAEMDEPLAGE